MFIFQDGRVVSMFKCWCEGGGEGGVEATGGKIVSCMVAQEDGPQEEEEAGCGGGTEMGLQGWRQGLHHAH